MPTFKVTDPNTGRTLRLTGDSPPTEQELEEIFSTVQPSSATTEVSQQGVSVAPKEKRSILGDIFERPAAAARAGIRGLAPGGETPAQAFTRGAILPKTVEPFQEEALRKTGEAVVGRAARRRGLFEPTKPFGRAAVLTESVSLGLPASAAGLAADIATNPANLLLALLGKAPGTKVVGRILGETKPAKALVRFLGKERGIPGRGLIQRVNTAFKNVKNPVEFAKKTRNSVFSAKQQVGKNFEQGIKNLSESNPDRTIDLSSQFRLMKDTIDDVATNPGLKSDVNSIVRRVKNPQDSKFIQSLIDNPEGARNLTLQQAQKIKVAVQQSPRIATKLKQGKFADWKTGEMELLDLLDDIRLAQSDVFPEIAQVRQPYADYMKAYKTVKNDFKPRVLLNKMRSGFGNEEIESMIRVVTPEDTLKEIAGFGKLSKAVKLGKIGAGIVAAGAAGKAILPRIGLRED